MGRAPCCSKVGLHRGSWTAREDTLLTNYIKFHGEGNWRSLPKNAGLLRCGKSCRLRWMNYLRPDIKRGNIGPDEEDLIIRLHSLLGNRWSIIAGRLPGRTDNEIKNYWNSHLSKKLKKQGIKVREGPTKGSSSKRPSKNQDKIRKKKKNTPNEDDNEAPKAIKIHAPKPTRLTKTLSIANSISSMEMSTPSENDRSDDMAWPDVDNDEQSLLGKSEQGLIENFGGYLDCGYESFDRVYEEYSQLLMNTEDDQFPLVSFVTESLFM